jgi:hypothetical protein
MMKTRKLEFDGCASLEIATSRLRMVVTLDRGPRIAFLGRPGGDNLFYWKVDGAGYGDWRMLGGHRVWVTRPMADESEDAYAADNEPCELSESGSAITVTGGLHPFLKTRRGFSMRQIDEDAVEVTSFVRNEGPMLYSAGVWCLTCALPRPGMTLGIPLGDRRLDWDLVKVVFARSWAGHTARVNDPQVRFNEDFMIVEPQGVEAKRMLWAPHGILALTWPEQTLSFIKRTHSVLGAQYPHGCNLAVYIGPENFMLEMESMGAERTLAKGETAVNVESWRLTDQVFDWTDAERVIRLIS